MKPTFIGGCDRSGTTFLGAILGAHADCACVPESQFVVGLLREGPPIRSVEDVRQAFERIRADFRFQLWGLGVEWDERVAHPVGSSYPGLIEWLARQHAEQHGKPDAAIWVDHTPSNTKHAATLLDLFPDATFIHLVRDGRAVTSSIRPLDWGPNVVTSSAPWWAERVGYGIAAEARFGPARVLRVRYEDLVLDTERSVREIVAFLGIPFDPAMLEAGGFRRPLYTRDQHALVGRPPDRKRVDAWKDSLSDREVEIFEHLTGDLLSYLGYEPRYGVHAARPTYAERLRYGLEETFTHYVVNRARRAVRARRTRRIQRSTPAGARTIGHVGTVPGAVNG